MYYSSFSHSLVTEEEAHMQILQFCEYWQRMTHPNVNFENYFIKHPDLISIEHWPTSFKKQDEAD